MDREKVIREIEDALSDNLAKAGYIYGLSLDGLKDKALTDAHALLKEQEAVEPSFKQDEKGIFVWCCGSCGAYMYHIYDGIDKAKEYAKFCRQCGKPVLWEGR